MDRFDAFDDLYRAHQRAVALLKTAQEYGESAGADTTVMLAIDTVVDLLDGKETEWDALDGAVCGRPWLMLYRRGCNIRGGISFIYMAQILLLCITITMYNNV